MRQELPLLMDIYKSLRRYSIRISFKTGQTFPREMVGWEMQEKSAT